MIKVLVADNDALARAEISNLLKSQPDISTVIDAPYDCELTNLCLEFCPDVIFIDIQSSIQINKEIVESIPLGPALIFTSAVEEHAFYAFELNAVGYLLKPLSDVRFYNALTKARMVLSNQTSTTLIRATNLLEKIYPKNTGEYKSRLIVRDPGSIRLIEVKNINYILGAGNYVDVYLLDGSNILHRATLTALVEQLDPDIFIRIHRSSIIRRDSVYELRSNDNGDYTVVLKTGEHLTLSRRNRGKLEALLEE